MRGLKTVLVTALLAFAAGKRQNVLQAQAGDPSASMLLQVESALEKGTPAETILRMIAKFEADVKEEQTTAERKWHGTSAECSDALKALDGEVGAMQAKVATAAAEAQKQEKAIKALLKEQKSKSDASDVNFAAVHSLQAAVKKGQAARDAQRADFETLHKENLALLESVRSVRAFVMKTYANTEADSTETSSPAVVEEEHVVASLLEVARTSRSTSEMQAELGVAVKALEEGKVNVRAVLDLLGKMEANTLKSDKDAASLENEAAALWSAEKAKHAAKLSALLKERASLAHALTEVARKVEADQAAHGKAEAAHAVRLEALRSRAALLDARRAECTRKHTVHKAESATRQEDVNVLGSLRGMLGGFERRVEGKEEAAERKRVEEAAVKRDVNRKRVRSCLELLELGAEAGETASGVYTLFADPADHTTAYRAYCDMETAGGGWTLTAVIANDATDAWSHTAKHGDLGDRGSLWESAAVKGEVTAHTFKDGADFKSPAFNALAADEVMMTFNGEPLLRTAGGCLNGVSLRQFFNKNPFSCKGDRYECFFGTGHCSGSCHHTCPVAEQWQTPAVDVVTGGQEATHVMLKAGSAIAAQPGHVNRAYISTLPSRASIDYPEGLGAYKGFAKFAFSHDMALHRSSLARPYDRVQQNAVFVREAAPHTRAVLHPGKAAASCAAHLAAGRTASGLYHIQPEGAVKAFPAYCDMDTAEGGWTLVAVVSNRNNEHWAFGDDDGAAGQKSSLWENLATLGVTSKRSPTAGADYKSLAFATVVADEVMVTHNAEPLLRTSKTCLGQRTFGHALNRLPFSCTGADRSCFYGPGKCAAHNGCTHACTVAEQFFAPTDSVIVRGTNATELWLKAGAAEGAQDYNKERAYISTNSARNGFAFPEGLGAFVGFTDKTFSHNMAAHTKGARRPEDESLFSAVYVR